MAWSIDGAWLASGSADASIRIWSFERLITANNSNSKVSASEAGLLELPTSQGKAVNQVTWCPWRTELLATASSDRNLCIWNINECLKAKDTATLQPVFKIEFDAEVMLVAWHPTKPLLAAGSRADKVYIYEISEKSARLLHTLSFKLDVNDLSFNQDSLAVALGDGSVSIYDPSFTNPKSLQIHTSDCLCARFQGDLLVTGGADAQVTVWKSDTLLPLKCFNRMEWSIRAVSVSHDSAFLAIGTEDTFLAIEDIKSGQLVAKIPTSSRASRHGTPINCIAWHPSKHIFVFAGEEVDDRTGRFTGVIKLIGTQ